MLDLRTACRDWYKPYDLISFNVATDDYGELMSYIYTLLIQDSSNKMWGPDNTVVWVLHQQAVNRKPFKWFILELVGAGDNKIMLAIRRDNLYITGFTDGSGLWYIFSNRLPARRRLPWSGRRVEESGGGSRQQADHP